MSSRNSLLLLVAVALGAACTEPASLTGAGATFPFPLYSRWMSDYAAQKKVQINYQSIGSGGGVKQISEQTVDFGASDGPMSDKELAAAKGGAILHIPMVLGAVAIAYNLAEVSDTLKFDSDVIADIFLGKITKWNDARLAALNPGVKLPAMDITTVHRSDGSGTTYVFTDYLSTVSAAWADTAGSGPGKGKDVSWPVGLGGQGNEQVAGTVKQTPGSVGYIETVYALQNHSPVGKVKNQAGNFVAPNQASIMAAAAEAVAALGPDTDYRVSIVNAPGADAYPIASFTWLLVYKQQTDATKGRALVDFMKWAVTEGQTQASELHYGPLPESMRTALLKRIESIILP